MASKITTEKSNKTKTTKTIEMKECPHCKGEFHPSGLASHIKACPQQPKEKNIMKKDPATDTDTASSKKIDEPKKTKKSASDLLLGATMLLLVFAVAIGLANLFGNTDSDKPVAVSQPEEVTEDPNAIEFTRDTPRNSVHEAPAEIVKFDIFQSASTGVVAIPIIKDGDNVGPYLGHTPPRSEIRPKGNFWVGASYKLVKIVDDDGQPLPGFPGISRTVDGEKKHQRFIQAMVPVPQGKG